MFRLKKGECCLIDLNSWFSRSVVASKTTFLSSLTQTLIRVKYNNYLPLSKEEFAVCRYWHWLEVVFCDFHSGIASKISRNIRALVSLFLARQRSKLHRRNICFLISTFKVWMNEINLHTAYCNSWTFPPWRKFWSASRFLCLFHYSTVRVSVLKSTFLKENCFHHSFSNSHRQEKCHRAISALSDFLERYFCALALVSSTC